MNLHLLIFAAADKAAVEEYLKASGLPSATLYLGTTLSSYYVDTQSFAKQVDNRILWREPLQVNARPHPLLPSYS